MRLARLLLPSIAAGCPFSAFFNHMALGRIYDRLVLLTNQLMTYHALRMLLS
jgi:hypothetical protein